MSQNSTTKAFAKEGKILTRAEKEERYHLGRYSMPAPPVTTAQWTDADWINFIDVNGRWL